MTTVTERSKLSRDEILLALMYRDGTKCMYPGCDHELNFDVIDGPQEVTIDHWIPQSKAYEMGWTFEQVWDLSNLKLMAKKCNAKKGDLMPNEDGTLPEKKVRTFKYRRDARLQRPEVCTSCNSGRNLQEDEWCNACGSGPMPERWPRWKKMDFTDCDHDVFYCDPCFFDRSMRRPVIDVLLTGGDGYE